MESFTLAAQSAVALTGNFAGADVVDGNLYYIVLGTSNGTQVIAQIHAAKFSTGAAFALTVSLPAGSYNVGRIGTANDIYFVNAAGNSGGGVSSEEGQGAANITSTLSVRTRNAPFVTSGPTIGARGSL